MNDKTNLDKFVDSLLFDYILTFSVLTQKRLTSLDSLREHKQTTEFITLSPLSFRNQIVVFIYIDKIISERERFVSMFNEDTLFENFSFLEPFAIEAIVDNNNEELSIYLKNLNETVYEIFTKIKDLMTIRANGIKSGFEVSYKEEKKEIAELYKSEEYHRFDKDTEWLHIEPIIDGIKAKYSEVIKFREMLISNTVVNYNFNENIIVFNKKSCLTTGFSYSTTGGYSGGFFKSVMQSLSGLSRGNEIIEIDTITQLRKIFDKTDTAKNREAINRALYADDVDELIDSFNSDKELFQHALDSDVFSNKIDTIRKIGVIYEFKKKYENHKKDIELEILKIFSNDKESLVFKLVELELFLKKKTDLFSDGVFFRNKDGFDFEEHFKKTLKTLVFSSVDDIFKKQSGNT